jgi:hypothetical protein
MGRINLGAKAMSPSARHPTYVEGVYDMCEGDDVFYRLMRAMMDLWSAICLISHFRLQFFFTCCASCHHGLRH